MNSVNLAAAKPVDSAASKPHPFFFRQQDKKIQKWIAAGMPLYIYKEHTEFSKFLENSPLLNQIKVTRDRPFVVDGEAAILVEGRPMKWSEVKKKFTIAYLRVFDEQFVVDKATRALFTYLDNGRGLQKHHPFFSDKKVISKLDKEEIDAVLKCAQLFVRPEEKELSDEERVQRNQERVHVLQIVSSYTRKGDSHLHQLLVNPTHPYLRLVAGRDNQQLNMHAGEVYEVGYRSKNRICPWWQGKRSANPQFLPFMATQGLFRSPDVAEYIPCDERLVTNICLSDQEAEAFYKFTESYHRDSIHLDNEIGFHIVVQNCTTYVRKALQASGIAVPTEISAAELIKRIMPACLLDGTRSIRKIKQAAGRKISQVVFFVPSSLKAGCKYVAAKIAAVVKAVFEAVAGLFVTLVHLALGDAVGRGGRAFVLTGEPPSEINRGSCNWKNWFSLSGYRFHIPGILQEWQRAQSSTVTYDHPVKLTIVPH